MANEGQISLSGGSSIVSAVIDWSATTNESANTTTITAILFVIKNQTVATSGTWDYSLKAGDKSASGSEYYQLKDEYWRVASVTKTVTHNSDGTAPSVTISASFKAPSGTSLAGNTWSGSASIKVDSIARNSSLSLGASSVQMGKKLLITINRENPNFTHTLKCAFGGKTINIATDVASSYAWDVPDLAAYCNNATSGTATITCIAYNGSTKIGESTATVTLTVPDATTPSFPDGDVIIGAGNSIGTERGSANFLLTLTYEFNGATGTIVEKGTSNFIWWTPYELAAKIPALTYGTGTLTCITYNGTAEVGRKSITFKAVVPNNSTTQPKFTEEGFVLSPSGLPTEFLEYIGWIYLRGMTSVRAEFKAESTYSQIASCKLAVSGMTASGNPATSGYLTVSGEVKVTGTVTDARGYSTSVTKTITVIPYDKPNIIPHSGQNIVICERCLADGLPDPKGQYLLIKAGRKYSPIVLDGVQMNTCQLAYRIKASTEEDFSAWFVILNSNDLTQDEISITLRYNILSSTVSYHVQIGVIDFINYALGNDPFIMDFVVSTDDISVHLRPGGKGVAVGKYSEEDYLFDIHSDWDLGYKGSRVMDFVVEHGTDGIWMYRKWYSGLFEAWGTDMTTPSGGYIAGEFPISFPEKPKLFVSNNYDNAGFNVVIKQVSIANGAWRYLLYIRDTSGAVRNVNDDGLDLYVVGRWK